MSIQLPEPLLRGTERSFEIAQLWEGHSVHTTSPNESRCMSLVLPPWQRDFVWSVLDQTRFIEGIFLGLGTGYYVVNGRDYNQDGSFKAMSGWLIDGQQRITSISRFINDQLPIFDGIVYSQISRVDQIKRFERLPFPCIELDYCDDEATLLQLYLRLAFSGIPHTEDEYARLSSRTTVGS